MLDRDWIATHIPHQGSMCLLDRVIAWDGTRIQCAADSHHAGDNPLRTYGRLGAACGIEYAAQAMAVHGVLLAQQSEARSAPRAGFLVSARSVALQVARLDDIAEELMIEATCIMSNAGNILYEFSISAAQQSLLHGRAAVVLDAKAALKESS
jgi:predicted hotdog family 3-hydroxylacyl-ACP dehydratase